MLHNGLCFVKWGKLAQPCWQADIVLWWRVHVFILAGGSQLRADGTWLSGFTGGPPICLQWGLSPDNETGLLRKWSSEWKGRYKLIRQFISDSLMFHNGPGSDNLPYTAPQCGSKYLIPCTKLQIKRCALTAINQWLWCEDKLHHLCCHFNHIIFAPFNSPLMYFLSLCFALL